MPHTGAFTATIFSDSLQCDLTVPMATLLFSCVCVELSIGRLLPRISSQVVPLKVRLCRVLSGCPVRVERRALEAHLSACSFRRECPKGCGRMLPSLDPSQHNCVAELRIEVEMLRYALTVTSKAHCCCCCCC